MVVIRFMRDLSPYSPAVGHCTKLVDSGNPIKTSAVNDRSVPAGRDAEYVGFMSSNVLQLGKVLSVKEAELSI